MKRRICKNMCMVALLSIVLSTLLTTWMFSQDLQTQMRTSVNTEVRYMEAAMEVSGEDFLTRLSSRGDGGIINRITWVAADGTVLYDSYADSKTMENHADRPEIRQALENGRGQWVRSSETLANKTYYSAVRLSDGTVVRVASTTKSGWITLASTIPWLIVMTMVIFVLAVLLAERQTRKIVEPINRLNPDSPQKEKIYDELSPLVRRLEKQKQTIQQQLDTLKERQEEFTAITENMKEGFIIVDSKADVISYNTSAIRILGVDFAVTGDANVNVLSFNRSSTFRQVVDSALQGIRSEQNLALNGRFYQIIANPVAETGNKNGAVVVILDVTEQQSREELRREFSANVSHELKTPLTSISGYAEIMKNGLVQPTDMAPFANKIYTEAQRLITLIEDIIKLSRLDETQAEIEKSTVDLYIQAEAVLNRLQDKAKAGQVTLQLNGTPIAIKGTAQILDEMIFNLCDNAVKYNKPGGTVKVSVLMEGGHPVLSVEDNGIGIPEGEQERIFERFYRVDKSHSRKIEGTGLGLSIVKHGALYHKARVEMKSALGRGTRVRVIFPQLFG